MGERKALKLNYRIISLILAVALVLGVAAVLIFYRRGYYPSFAVTGDVKNTINIDSSCDFETCAMQRDGRNYTCFSLSDIINEASPYSANNTIVLRGSDGLIAAVGSDKLDGMYITFTPENGWEMINIYHPASSNIKQLSEVWVVASNEVADISVNIITADQNAISYTPGQFFMSETAFAPVFQGRSEKAGEIGRFDVAVYTQQRYKKILDIVPDASDALVMGTKGQYVYDISPGRLIMIGNDFYYQFSDGKTTMENVRGILINPPAASNMDAYFEAVNNLSAGQRVMVILMDGFGYHQYTYAAENKYAPYLGSFDPRQCTSVYKPVTHAGTAAILTGQPPSVNGIYQRGMMDLKSTDIFEYVAKVGKTSVYIEGDIKLLNTSIKPTLNADSNNNGFTDDEVFESATKSISSGADFIFAHFHGIDDMGHNYGDTDVRTMEKIKEIDAYIAALAKNFSGRIIITADHGMHATADGGSHGLFHHEDMIVPYFSYLND
ncbi:MAG: alkaline phosphatase family protein [Christensenellales bacterium]|jgi:hypothetical protein